MADSTSVKNYSYPDYAEGAQTAEALKAKGNALLAEGVFQASVDCYAAAIRLDPTRAELYINLGYALLQLGQNANACAALSRAAEMDSQSPDAHYMLAQSFIATGDSASAKASLFNAVQVNPNFDFAFRDLGLLAERMGQQAEATVHYEKALQINAEFEAVLESLASLLLDQGKVALALPYLEKSHRLKPTAINKARLGVCLHDLFRESEGAHYVDEALGMEPNNLFILVIKTKILFETNQDTEALAVAQRAYELYPHHAQAASNLGVAYGRLARFEDALKYHLLAVSQPNPLATMYGNLSNVYVGLMQVRESIKAAEKGLEINPEMGELHWRKAAGHLLLGDFKQGWPHYEYRWMRTRQIRNPKPDLPQPPWTGRESLLGKKIYVYQEQGLGDFIQFARYLPALIDFGAQVYVHAPQAIVPVLRTLPNAARLHFVNPGDRLPSMDYQCALLSLPLAFGTTVVDIPFSKEPYLAADPALVLAWRKRLGASSSRRVGLVWSGNPTHSDDKNRSMPLAQMLGALPAGLSLLAVQKDIRLGDEATLQSRPDIYVARKHLDSFADTAALLTCLDLVICVDTSIAHLAGALGVPVWILLPQLPDWRWMLDRKDSPWYPSATLYRQHRRGDWSEPFEEIRRGLAALT